MRRLTFLIPAIAVVLVAQHTFSFDSLVRLKSAGMGDEVIISAIAAASAIEIDTSTDGLIAMKEAGLSQAVIKAVLDKQIQLGSSSGGTSSKTAEREPRQGASTPKAQIESDSVPAPPATSKSSLPVLSSASDLRFRTVARRGYSVAIPVDWRKKNSGTVFVPDGGWKGGHIRTGVNISVYESEARIDLKAATDELVRKIQAANRRLAVVQDSGDPVEVGKKEGYSCFFVNDDDQERVWMVTALYPRGLFFVISAAPMADFDALQPIFRHIVDSVQFKASGSGR